MITYYSVEARNIGAPAAEYSGNNGNVWMQEHYVPTNDAITTHTVFRDIYEYDDLNRLKQDTGVQKDTANNWTTPHQQAFNFDQWGNRTINAGATFGANINNLAFTASTATNRLDKPGGSVCTGSKNGMCYDQAGNLIFDNYSASPGGDREYDGENRMTKGWGTGGWNYYVYDGDGQRVRRLAWVGGFLVEYWQVYDFDGALIAEYLANGAAGMTSKEYGYRGGQMLLVGGCDVARWLVTDHLGTPRIKVDVTGSLANVKRNDYLPFGEDLTAGMGNGSLRSGTMGYYPTDCLPQKFTGKERDSETGLDYFGARYFASVQGRFTSPDLPFADQFESDPQSWNLYTYVGNNPVNGIDPTGRYKCKSDGSCIGDYDGEKHGDLYWNKKEGLWETRKEFEFRGGSEKLRNEVELALRQLDFQRRFGNSDRTGARGVAALAGTMVARPPYTPQNLVVPTALLLGAGLVYLTNYNNLPAPVLVDPNIYAKGGKKNIRNEWNEEAVRQVGNDVTAQIKWLRDAYKNATDPKVKQKIKEAQKAIGGRKSSGGDGQ